MSLKVVLYNDGILRQRGAEVTDFGPDLRRRAEAMIETMHEADGIGLAAQQVGVAEMLCVVDLGEISPETAGRAVLDGRPLPPAGFMPLVLVNPEVTDEPSARTGYEEGCLSFPGMTGWVERPERVSVRYRDVDGNGHRLTCDGLLARCIQHEVDHLNGILFIDRMDAGSLNRLRSKLERLERAGDP